LIVIPKETHCYWHQRDDPWRDGGDRQRTGQATGRHLITPRPNHNMPPRRAATRTPAARVQKDEEGPQTRPKRVSRVVDDSDDGAVDVPSDGSDDSDHKPVRKPGRKAAKPAPKRAPAPSAKASTTTSTKARKAAKALADEDDEEEEEEVKVKQEPVVTRPAPKGRAKAPPKGSRATAPTPAPASQRSSRAPSVVDSDLDEPLDTSPSKRTPRPTQKRPEPVALDEEENIVLETPKRQPPIIFSPVKPEPEEDKGPKPRLVIHKIVLVNFKSYAGRQEIGPFHKV